MTAMRSVGSPHRAGNQDSVGTSRSYALVADGVGGHAGGDVASSTVARRLVEAFDAADVPALDVPELRRLVSEANADVGRRAAADPGLAGMATTLTALVCGDGQLRVVHIGDSRAYRLHGTSGERVTRDDSLVQRLVDAGAIEAADAPHHPQRNIILGSLAGDADDVDALTVLTVPAYPGDRWILCSDGLTDELDDDDVIAIAARAEGPDVVADELLAAARDAGGRDDISVAVCDVVLDAGAAPEPGRCLGAAAGPGG